MDDEKIEIKIINNSAEDTDDTSDVIYINVEANQLRNSEEEESNDLAFTLSSGM